MSHLNDTPVVGDYGTVIYHRLVQRGPEDEPWLGATIDPDAADELVQTVVRPDQTEEEIPLVASANPDFPATPDANVDGNPATNPSEWIPGSGWTNPTGWQAAGGWTETTVQRYRVDGDDTTGPWLDQAGQWTFRPRYTINSPAGSWGAPALVENQIWVAP
jgi:hypothetical protein